MVTSEKVVHECQLPYMEIPQGLRKIVFFFLRSSAPPLLCSLDNSIFALTCHQWVLPYSPFPPNYHNFQIRATVGIVEYKIELLYLDDCSLELLEIF